MAKKSANEKKLKRKRRQEQTVMAGQTEFDVIGLLRDQPLGTKPEVGDFLKKYVKSVRLLNCHSKIEVYPVFSYTVSKVFVDFLDGHQIVADFGSSPRRYYLWRGLDEVRVGEKDERRMAEFLQKLQEFQFVR